MQPIHLSKNEPSGDLAHPVLRATFQLLSGELEAFAERHALLIERFPRGFSMWSFLFQHPKGGAASLQFNIAVMPETGDLVASLLPHWWLNLEPGLRRLTADFSTTPVPSLAPDDVRQALERAFDQVIAMEQSALTREVWMLRDHRIPDLPWPKGLTGSRESPGR